MKIKSNDTIAAISTAFGNAGIAILRISGKESLPILKKVFEPKGAKFKSRKFYYGKIVGKKREVIDEVLAVFFKAPKSYTREDMAEIHCHGGFVTAKKILEEALDEDARMASPGEFTERAFLAGRIDLTQAEAIADIIYAKSDKAQRVAEEQLEGSLKKEIRHILKLVLDVYSHALTDIDFPEEDIPELTKTDILKKIKKPISEIEKLLRGAQVGTIYKEGLKAALVGLPNVGKSSLLNALVKDARAIVTDVPGTTRDVLEDQIEIKGLLVRLFDTAGITKTEDKVEKEGVSRSFKAIKEADMVFLIVEKFGEIKKFFSHLKSRLKKDLESKKTIIVRNKVDLKRTPGVFKEPEKLNVISVCETSAKTGKGIKGLEKALQEELEKFDSESGVLATNLRQKKLLEKASASLKAVEKLSKNNEALDKILLELDEARQSLEEIIGEKVTLSLLEKVFSRFCVGK